MENSHFHSLVSSKIVEQKAQKSFKDYLLAFKRSAPRSVFKFHSYERPTYNLKLSASETIPNHAIV